MKSIRTVKKLRRRGRNSARGWLAQAIKTYAKALESTERETPRDELHQQVIQFTEQILGSVRQSQRCSQSVHELLEESLAFLAKELGADEPAIDAAIVKRHDKQSKTSQQNIEPSFKGLTPLEKLSSLPPLQECPTLDRGDDGRMTEDSAARLLNYHPEVVLFAPQIPPNTGTVARLCAAFSCRLHLIEPIGFDVTEKSFRRAGLDYWPFVELYVHESWESFLLSRPNRRVILVETGGHSSPSGFDYKPGDLLVFGAETFGIPRHILSDVEENQRGQVVTIPMFDRGVRSLNLANSVSIVAHCALARLHTH
jgi:tRNA (cytidine/uridine-2'-O-)-methyltransferase